MPDIKCDVCEGTGQETDDGGWPVDCHLCDGSGFLDWDEGEDEADIAAATAAMNEPTTPLDEVAAEIATKN